MIAQRWVSASEWSPAETPRSPLPLPFFPFRCAWVSPGRDRVGGFGGRVGRGAGLQGADQQRMNGCRRSADGLITARVRGELRRRQRRLFSVDLVMAKLRKAFTHNRLAM